MKRAVTLGIGALALAGMTLPTSAADLGARPMTRAPIMAPISVYDWSGFYIGAHIGGVWADKDWTDVTFLPPLPLGSHQASGFLAGAQVGFNYQVGTWVFGVEGQGSWTNADGEHTCVIGFTICRTEMNFVGTVAGRIGYAFNNVLLYGKGGVAFVDEDFLLLAAPAGVAFAASTNDSTRTGWMAGVGLEWGITPNWSAKIEYNYMDFGTQNINFVTLGGVPFAIEAIDQQVHVVKAGINYRFNWGVPVAARY